MISRLASLKFVAVLGCFLALAACSKKNTPDLNAGTGPGAAAVPGSEQDFTVNVGDRVFFETDQTELTALGRSTLDKQAQWLTNYSQYSFTVEGHADERGTREYNLALGEKRANSAKDFLVANGIPANRVKVISYGKERPVALGHDEASWAQNRRAVTVITSGAAGS